MALQNHPERISLSDLAREYGGTGMLALSQYYSGAGRVPWGTKGYPFWVETTIPSGGRIGLGNFHGSRNQQLIRITESTWWTCPAGVYNIAAWLVAGGGRGGNGWGDEGGGGGGAGGCLYLSWISVTPGQSYEIIIGAGGADGVREPTGTSSNGFTRYSMVFPRSNDTTAFGHRAIGGGIGGMRGDSRSGNFGNQSICHRNSDNTFDWIYNAGKSGGSGGGATGYYGWTAGSPGTPGQGNAGSHAAEESDAGGGGGAWGMGLPGNAGGGVGATLSFAGQYYEFGGGGACGPGHWNADWIPGGRGGGGASSKWGGQGAGAWATGGGGAGGSAGAWPQAGPYKYGANGGSGVVFILIGA